MAMSLDQIRHELVEDSNPVHRMGISTEEYTKRLETIASIGPIQDELPELKIRAEHGRVDMSIKHWSATRQWCFFGVWSVLFGLACCLSQIVTERDLSMHTRVQGTGPRTVADFEPASDIMAAPTSHWSASPLMSSDILGEMCSMVEIEGMAEDIAVERVQKSLLGVIVVLIQVLDAPTSTVEDKRSLADMLINAMSRIILVSEVIELEIQIIDLSDILMRMDRVPELKSFDWVLMRFEKMAEERRIL